MSELQCYENLTVDVKRGENTALKFQSQLLF